MSVSGISPWPVASEIDLSDVVSVQEDSTLEGSVTQCAGGKFYELTTQRYASDCLFENLCVWSAFPLELREGLEMQKFAFLIGYAHSDEAFCQDLMSQTTYREELETFQSCITRPCNAILFSSHPQDLFNLFGDSDQDFRSERSIAEYFVRREPLLLKYLDSFQEDATIVALAMEKNSEAREFATGSLATLLFLSGRT